jgi:NAD(P)-dependent dehydrogenase (short-subunit alcohol dehydrogenase family)
MTKALAAELPEGMAAVAMNPGVIDTDMLRACMSEGAAAHPKADAWARIAAPALLALGPKDNGRSASIGLFED